MLSTPVPLILMLGSPLQLLVIALILLLLFGAGRLGDFGKGLGEGIKNFKKGLAGDDADSKRHKAVEARSAQTAPSAEAKAEAQKSEESESDQS